MGSSPTRATNRINMDWNKEIDKIYDMIINRNISIDEVSKMYNCKSYSIKYHLRKFGVRTKKFDIKEVVCRFCGKKFIPSYKGNIYCSDRCYRSDLSIRKRKEYHQKVEDWLSGKISGTSGFKHADFVKKYLMEKYDNKCQLCGWGEINRYTGNYPLVVHHIDGKSDNNDISNLMLLCPNCQSITPTYCGLNKEAAYNKSLYYGRKKCEEK